MERYKDAPYGYTLVAVLSPDKRKVLMEYRKKNPYKSKYNLFGGKIEKGEEITESAYRELEEETGIIKQDIDLKPIMAIKYLFTGIDLIVFYGILKDKSKVKMGRIHSGPTWFSIDSTFYDDRFAGEANIQHFIDYIKLIEGIETEC